MKRSESSTTPTAAYAEYKCRELELGKVQQETARYQGECAKLQHARDAASALAHQMDDRVAQLRTKLGTLQSSINRTRLQLWERKRSDLDKHIAAEKAWISQGSRCNQIPDRRYSPEYLALKEEYDKLKTDFQECNAEQKALDQEFESLIQETAQLTQNYQAACELLQTHNVACVQIEIAFRKARIESDTEILAKLEGRKRSKGE